jgi:hypothetical protein
MDKGFVREVRAKPGMPAWRRNEDGRTYALVITKLGRAAIRVADEGRTPMDALKDVGLPGPRTHKSKRPVASTPDSSDALVARAPDQGPARERDAARAQSSGLASQGSQCTGQSINSPRQGTTGRGGRPRGDVIVVYKVDRLMRSLADFAKLVESVSASRLVSRPEIPKCAAEAGPQNGAKKRLNASSARKRDRMPSPNPASVALFHASGDTPEKTGMPGCPSWTLIEPCVSRRSPTLGASWQVCWRWS